MVDLCSYNALRQDANMYTGGSDSETWELLGRDANCSSAYAHRQRLAGSSREAVRKDASRGGPPRTRGGYSPIHPAAQTPRAGPYSPLRASDLTDPWMRRSASDKHLDRLDSDRQDPQMQQSRFPESPRADVRQRRSDWVRPAERQQQAPAPTSHAFMSAAEDEGQAHQWTFPASPPRPRTKSGAPAAPTSRKSANFRELSLLQSFAQAVICTDLEGIITFWNRAAETMYGWKAEEVIGVSVLNVLIPSRLIKEASDIISRVAEGDSWTGRYSCLRRDGVVLNTVTTNSPIVDDDGNVVGVIGASIDANSISTDKSSVSRVYADRGRKAYSGTHGSTRIGEADQSADYRWFNRAEDTVSNAPSDASQGTDDSSRGSSKSLLQRLGCTSVQLLRKFSFGMSKSEDEAQQSPLARGCKDTRSFTGNASPSRTKYSSVCQDECSLDIREYNHAESQERGPSLQQQKQSFAASSYSHPLALDVNVLSRTSSGSGPGSTGGSTFGASCIGSPVNNSSSTRDGSVNFHQAEEDFQLQLALALRVAAEAAAVDDPVLVANVRGPIGSSKLMPGVSKIEATAYRYWVSNCLTYDDRIEDGFFEIWGMSPYVWSMCTDSNELGRMPLLESLRAVRPADAVFEVVLVDRSLDPDLRELEDKAVGLAYDSTELLDLARKLGKMVANVMGGMASSDEVLMEPWKACSAQVMQMVAGIVLPIGKLRTGLCRHRALLFKVMADSVGLPCRLARGSSYCGKEDTAMVVVRCPDDKEWMIDLLANPGHIMAPDARLSAPPAVIGSPLQFERPSPFAGSSISVMDWARSNVVSSNSTFDKTAGSSEAVATLASASALPNIAFRTTVIEPNGAVSEYSAAHSDNPGHWQIPLARDLPASVNSHPVVESGGGHDESAASVASNKSNLSRCEATQEKLVVEQSVVPPQKAVKILARETKRAWNEGEPKEGSAGLHADASLEQLILGNLRSGMWATEDVCKHMEATDVSNTIKGSVVKKMLVAADEVDIPWEDISIGERIGQGSYGKVYRADWQGSDVAVKVFLHQDLKYEALEEFRSEVAIMRRLRHPNVVLFMGAVTKPPNLSIVTEFCPRGSLFRLLHRPNRELDERRRVRMALDVAKGMNYLHRCSPPVVHRDLKSPNLLVDKNWTVKVCDFGLSRQKHSTFLSSKSSAGTPEWMAPEVLRNEPSDEKSDVYSFGVILWELSTLQVPWGGLNPLQVVGAVGFQHRRLPIPDTVDPTIASIIQACWRTDSKTRPSFADIMQELKPLQRPAVPSKLSASPDAME